MKKIILSLIVLLSLVGCKKDEQEITFMVPDKDEVFALFNTEGKKYTEHLYTDYQEMHTKGYVVSKDEEVSFINWVGKEIIPFGEYDSLEVVDNMLYATKDRDNKEDEENKKDKEEKDIFILNKKGEVLYTNEDMDIVLNDLPILKTDKEITVLYGEGKELYKGDKEVQYAKGSNDFENIVIGFSDQTQIYTDLESKDIKTIDFSRTGEYSIYDNNETEMLLYDEKSESFIYVSIEDGKTYESKIAAKDIYFDELDNIIAIKDNNIFLYQRKGNFVEMNSYYSSAEQYIERSTEAYGPHKIIQGGVDDGQLIDCQIYPGAQLITSKTFPVYVKDKGYQFYNFDREQIIKETYLDALPFNQLEQSVVKRDDKGYVVINGAGEVLTKKAYSKIVYMGSSHYAVYNKNGNFGVIDAKGEELLPVEYNYMPENHYITYDEKGYFILSKYGRSYVYDIEDDMAEVLSMEGSLEFVNDGYFKLGDRYYNFEGEELK